ncbi:MAG: hypothetical protein QOE38_1941, partial [Thermoleophilaceae bacterium]|nr:hypothetical protein [Thermoleophilaceae bacterium]
MFAPSAGAWTPFNSQSAPTGKASPPQVLRRAEQAFTKGGDLSPLLRRLALDLPYLKRAERTRARRLLARPTDGSADPQQNGWSAPEADASPLCSQHFCVHWVETSSDAPPLADGNHNGVPDWVETVSATAEHVFSVENGQLGWRTPRGDGSEGGGSNLTDIYLEDVGGSGIYGYAAPDPQPQRSSLFAYLVLDNDFSDAQFPGYSSPVDPLDVTLAHEYNHVLQFNYDSNEDTWMLESTAVWMEGKVYDPVHDYLQYLPGWTQLTAQPITSFNGDNPNDRTNVKVYGSSVWNKWLDARYGEAIVRNAWEDSVQANSFAPRAYDVTIRQHGGGGFSKEFSQFAASTAEWQAQNSGFPEGSLYPDVQRTGVLDVNGAPHTARLDHTTFAIADVPVSSAPRIRLAMSAPSGTSAAVALVGLTGGSPGGTLVEVEHFLGKGGNGTVTLENPGNLTRLSAVLVNADTKHGAFSQVLGDYPYRRNNQVIYTHASTDFTAPRVKGGTTAPRKVTLTFSEPVLGVSGHSLKIAGVSGKVKFTPGSRTATFVPRQALKAGRRYRVKLSSAITDLTLN